MSAARETTITTINITAITGEIASSGCWEDTSEDLSFTPGKIFRNILVIIKASYLHSKSTSILVEWYNNCTIFFNKSEKILG